MDLSDEDVKRLEALGYSQYEFSTSLDNSSRQLRNIDGHCFFYDPSTTRCRVYSCRPFGCRIYPVVYIVGAGIGIDSFCPMSDTVDASDLKVKGRILLHHLERIGKIPREKC